MMKPISEIEARITYGIAGHTALIDRYRYEDNGQHWLTLTMTLSLEIGSS